MVAFIIIVLLICLVLGSAGARSVLGSLIAAAGVLVVVALGLGACAIAMLAVAS